MSLPSLTSGTSVDTSIHQVSYPRDHYQGPESYGYGHSHGHGLGHHQVDNANATDLTYPCVFSILNCYQTFTTPEYWKTHVLSHFRTFEPPAIARCPFCSDLALFSSSSSSSPPPSPESRSAPASVTTTTTTSRPQSQLSGRLDSPGTFFSTPQTRAWDALLDHLVLHYQEEFEQSRNNHPQHTEPNTDADPDTDTGIPSVSRPRPRPTRHTKPDFELLRYLYTLRLITEDQWKAAIQLGVLPGSPTDRRGEQSVRQRVGSADEPFWGLFSPRRERRRLSTRGGERSGSPGPRSRRTPSERPGVVLSSC